MLGVRVAQKLGKQNCGWAQNTNKQILITYFVNTGNTRYLGTKHLVSIDVRLQLSSIENLIHQTLKFYKIQPAEGCAPKSQGSFTYAVHSISEIKGLIKL